MNRLSGETSPYLRQHQRNPVDWFPWGDEAFAVARDRDVPVLLSVGYSACHWCHVMAHECFDDVDVASAMNASFVNVKVDREERPDVDALYMDAVQALTGRGGWPMTVLMDPDGRPFWAGTYLPKAGMLALIEAVDDAWVNRRDELGASATELLAAIGRNTTVIPIARIPSLAAVDGALQQVVAAFDAEWGGFGRPPKFPSTHHLELVLRAFMAQPESRGGDASTVLTTTLDAMASGGMYDHIGGGFARYSTDREWLVPHFEKMLYDQAMLVKIYRQAYSVLGIPLYRQVVEETIAYVLRELRQPDRGFSSAQDADSPDDQGIGVEGLFHTWTPTEARAALDGLDASTVDDALAWFGISDAGNFEGRSIPNRIAHRGELARPPAIEHARELLFAARERRARPALDDKVLTEWNGWFVHALADAAMTFRRDDWKAAAVETGEFLLRELRTADGRWMRSWHADGTPQARHRAFAGDHAALIEAFLRLSELTGQARWLHAARETADAMLAWHWDPVDGGLFTTADDAEELVVRQKDLHDGATPSANSSAAHGLVRLSALTGEQRYAHHADRILQLLGATVERTPGAVSNALLAIQLRHLGLTEVAIVGDAPALVTVAQALWRPDVVLAWGEPYDSPLWGGRTEGFAYVCRDYVCEAPTDSPEVLYRQITGHAVPEGMSLRP